MVAEVLYEAEGAPSVEGMTCPLTDIKAGEWYTDAVIWAYNAGVVAGRSDGTFCPDDTITRASANIAGLKTAYVNTINVLDILGNEKFIITEEAVKLVEEVYA